MQVGYNDAACVRIEQARKTQQNQHNLASARTLRRYAVDSVAFHRQWAL